MKFYASPLGLESALNLYRITVPASDFHTDPLSESVTNAPAPPSAPQLHASKQKCLQPGQRPVDVTGRLGLDVCLSMCASGQTAAFLQVAGGALGKADPETPRVMHSGISSPCML